MVVESPEDWRADVTQEEREEIEALASPYGGTQINRVGKLYDQLMKVIADPARVPTSAIHAGSYPAQASWDEWGRGYGKGARGSSVAGTTTTPDVLVIRMASRSEALGALRAVAEQGEAPGDATAGDVEHSHFRRFLEMFRKFPKEGSWDPARNLPTNPLAPGPAASAGQTPIKDAEAGIWANVFNLRFSTAPHFQLL